MNNTNRNEKENVAQKKSEKKDLSLKSKIIRSTIVVVVIVALVVLGYYILVWTGVWEQVNDVEKLRDLILSWGFWGRLGFVLLSFLQVTFIPLPSTVTIIACALAYNDPLQATLLSLAGILPGSLFAFFLGRVFGRKLVVFMVGEKTCEKWVNFLNNAKYSFFIMMLLPLFPDDVLCLVAGLTDMSWTFFTVTNLICRPIGVIMVAYLGGGFIIPYHGWGLAVWAVLILAIIVVIVLSYKYQAQIEKFIFKIFKNKDKNLKNAIDVAEGKKEVLSEEASEESVKNKKDVAKEDAKTVKKKIIEKKDINELKK